MRGTTTAPDITRWPVIGDGDHNPKIHTYLVPVEREPKIGDVALCGHRKVIDPFHSEAAALASGLPVCERCKAL